MSRIACLLAVLALAGAAAAVEPSLTGPSSTYIRLWTAPNGVQYLEMTTAPSSMPAQQVMEGTNTVRVELIRLSGPAPTTTAVSGTTMAGALTAGSAIAVTGAAGATIYYETQQLEQQQHLLDSYRTAPDGSGYIGGYDDATIDAVTSPTPWMDYYGDYFYQNYLAWGLSSNG